MAKIIKSTSQIINSKFLPYYCSNCFMKLQKFTSYCEYCGEIFSNYENVLIEIYENKREDEIKTC